MAKRKVFVICFSIIIVILILAIASKSYNFVSAIVSYQSSSNRIKSYYEVPNISLIKISHTNVTVEAGYYRYGDVDKSGTIDKYDIDGLKQYISGGIVFDDVSQALADVNDDKVVNQTDLTILEKYVLSVDTEKYNSKNNLLDYCISKNNDSNQCVWVSSNVFEMKEYTNYYAFVKDKKNNIVSNVKEFVFEEEKYEDM